MPVVPVDPHLHPIIKRHQHHPGDGALIAGLEARPLIITSDEFDAGSGFDHSFAFLFIRRIAFSASVFVE